MLYRQICLHCSFSNAVMTVCSTAVSLGTLGIQTNKLPTHQQPEQTAHGSELCMQGLGELGKHKSRLEKEKEAAAAARKAAGGSPAPGKLPSYMRPTSASKAMQKVHPSCTPHSSFIHSCPACNPTSDSCVTPVLQLDSCYPLYSLSLLPHTALI